MLSLNKGYGHKLIDSNWTSQGAALYGSDQRGVSAIWLFIHILVLDVNVKDLSSALRLKALGQIFHSQL